MIIAVTGPREPLPGTEDWVNAWIDSLRPEVRLICGGADGVDSMATKRARARGMMVDIVRPDYRAFPAKLAPLVRNAEIVSRCDYVYGFWHGKPYGGTLNTLWLNQVLLKAKPHWCIIDPDVDNMEANAAFNKVCDNPPTHWVQALNLWKQSVLQQGN